MGGPEGPHYTILENLLTRGLAPRRYPLCRTPHCRSSMRSIEIPREVWTDRLDEFAKVHDGWLVSLDVLGPAIGAQPEVDNLPLSGVSSDHADTITISVARSMTEHFTHVIHAVTRVDVEQTEEGADAALQIESADGTKTVLRFRAAVLPETVDGVVRR